MPGFARSAGIVAAFMLAACSNGRGSLDQATSPNPPPSAPGQVGFTIGGAASGLTGTGLVLQLNGANDLAISADGPFTFSTTLESGAAYEVTVLTQPSGQTCSVANGTGAVGSSNIANVAVSCSALPRFSVGGNASGIQGTGLVLRLNGATDLPIASNGPFAFPAMLENGARFDVVVHTQPNNPAQSCSLTNGSGTIAGANVTNLALTCTTRTFTVGGTVEGLGAPTGLVLRLNGAGDLAIPANGAFMFPTPLPSGTTYEVSVLASPTVPLQVCSATNAIGTIRDRDVRDVRVRCATQTFSIGGTVAGLRGQGLTLLNNEGDRIEIAADGTFKFPTKIANGSTYNVRVETHPENPTQACTVTNGTGTVPTADITNIVVTCSTSSFPVNVTVSGLAGTGLQLTNNGADTLQVTANGTVNFATPVLSGAAYSVQVARQPSTPTQTCTVTNGAGTITNAPVTVTVDCVTEDFLVYVRVTGLRGSGLQVSLNGRETLAIATDGNHAFATALPSGSSYTVSVVRTPVAPLQICFVTNPSGTVTDSDVTSVTVTCQRLLPFD
jgi:hypothetical protein